MPLTSPQDRGFTDESTSTLSLVSTRQSYPDTGDAQRHAGLFGIFGCFVTASSTTAAVYQFGAGTTWCQTFTAPTYPIKVSYTNPNTQLCPYDPAPGVVKSLVAGQQATAYTVTTTQNGHTVVVPIPAHVVPPPSTTYPVTCNGSLVVPAGTPSGTTIPLTGVTCSAVTP